MMKDRRIWRVLHALHGICRERRVGNAPAEMTLCTLREGWTKRHRTRGILPSHPSCALKEAALRVSLVLLPRLPLWAR